MAAKESTLKENQIGGVADTEKTLFAWKAQARPFKKQTREFYVTAISVAVLFGLILYLIDGIMPVLLIVAFGFLFYVIHNVEPEQVEYKLTTYGLRIAENLTFWDKFIRFWFSERMGSQVLVLETTNIIGRLELVINEKDKKELEKILSKYVLHEEATPGLLDKSANWVADKIQK